MSRKQIPTKTPSVARRKQGNICLGINLGLLHGHKQQGVS